MSVHSQWLKYFRQKCVRIPADYIYYVVFTVYFTKTKLQ